MPALNPEHLFDQADGLIDALSAGAPRQVDLRRAISSAYYGVFHFTMASLADEFVGVSQHARASSRYVLVYRSVNHNTLKGICDAVTRQSPPAKYVPYLPANGFGADLQAFATAVVDLQEKRHRATTIPNRDSGLRMSGLQSRLRGVLSAASAERTPSSGGCF